MSGVDLLDFHELPISTSFGLVVSLPVYHPAYMPNFVRVLCHILKRCKKTIMPGFSRLWDFGLEVMLEGLKKKLLRTTNFTAALR